MTGAQLGAQAVCHSPAPMSLGIRRWEITPVGAVTGLEHPG
jgi:hypothetical protein